VISITGEALTLTIGFVKSCFLDTYKALAGLL
jgi:hypothetical protein